MAPPGAANLELLQLPRTGTGTGSGIASGIGESFKV
jgi:hypothetical protein